MKKPFIPRLPAGRSEERGVTIVLVALAMVAIIAMAALSIDVITLYLAREEAQHSADTAALAAARVLALSGLTGDFNNSSGMWSAICGAGTGGGNPGLATQVANAVANQNTVGGIAPTSVNVTYSGGSASSGAGVNDCTSLNNTSFGINPVVTVRLTRSAMPNFFSRIWGSSGTQVSASATAEAFNPSNWGSYGSNRTIIPVQPRCVKPLFVPNLDPLDGGCTTNCRHFVDPGDGDIAHEGISLNGNDDGVIGEHFLLIPDCRHSTSGYCSMRTSPHPQANYPPNGFTVPYGSNNLEYLPGQIDNDSIAVPSGASSGNLFEHAVAGCDQTTVYQCGVPSANAVDLSEWPADDTQNGLTALINEDDPTSTSQPTGQDFINSHHNQYGTPSTYPFRIFAGSNNPTGLGSTTQITASNSIISVPIFDSSASIPNDQNTHAVTIVGFLQVFVNDVDQYGNVDVTVLNVAGCGNGASGDVSSSPIFGSSPVPVRLITPP